MLNLDGGYVYPSLTTDQHIFIALPWLFPLLALAAATALILASIATHKNAKPSAFNIPIITGAVIILATFCIIFYNGSSLKWNSASKNTEQFEAWLYDRYELMLPTNLLQELYEKEKITVVNVGNLQLIEQEAGTYYVIKQGYIELPIRENYATSIENKRQAQW